MNCHGLRRTWRGNRGIVLSQGETVNSPPTPRVILLLLRPPVVRDEPRFCRCLDLGVVMLLIDFGRAGGSCGCG